LCNFEETAKYRTVLANCLDFINEKTCLMYLGQKLGVEVDRSMKSIQKFLARELNIVEAE
jgi:hypothetical protein